MSHARPGKSFMEMLELILANHRQPNDPFSPQLLMAIFWEEGYFTNRKQQKGSAIGFGQTEPAELPKLTTQRARDKGYDVPGVSSTTRELSDAPAVAAPSCLLLYMFHSSQAATRDGKITAALHGYAGVDFKGPSALTREDRLRIIGNWLACERELKKLPFSVFTIVNYPGKLAQLEQRYMDALRLAKPFVRDYEFSQSPLVRFRDLLFPRNWFMPGLSAPVSGAAAASAGSSAPAGRSTGEHFLVVAGPGERLARVTRGDVVVRQAPNGGLPHAARIRSSLATPDDFFFEGVMAERGAPGLYAEVESRGRQPIARRIANHSGRVAGNMIVLRPSAPAASAAERFGEATDAELRQQRTGLVARITRSDLSWHEVPLQEGFRILVSWPILKDDFFVPVTAGESLEMARRFDVFPLSRAVMDQAYNVANRLTFRNERRPGHGRDSCRSRSDQTSASPIPRGK
ncbi:MAG: hypothetical protein ABI818_20745 [Acidobacteriota bacterium]